MAERSRTARNRRPWRLARISGPTGLLCTLAVLMMAAAPLAPGDPNRTDCMCRYHGNYYAQGDMICMRGPGGLRIARCEMLLNNPSWNITVNPCHGV